MSESPKKRGKQAAADADERARGGPATVALIFLAVGMIGICAVCGGGVYLFQPHLADDERSVGPLMDDVLSIDVPASFEPRGTIEWNLAFLMSLRGAYYETADRQQEGVLMFLAVEGGSLDKPNVRSHVERVLSEKSNGTVPLTPDGEPEERMVPIRGEDKPFTFETGVDPSSKVRYRLAHGVVDGENGQEVLVALRIREDAGWDDAATIAMLESIR